MKLKGMFVIFGILSFFLSSCRFDYIVRVNEDTTCTLIQHFKFNDAELKNAKNNLPSIPMNIEAKREFLESQGVKIVSWPSLYNSRADYDFEIQENFKSLDEMFKDYNASMKKEEFSVTNLSNYFTSVNILESNFSYIPDTLIAKYGLQETTMGLCFELNKPIAYTNGKLSRDRKTVTWDFKVKDTKYLKVLFQKQDRFLDFLVQSSEVFILYSIGVILLIRVKRKEQNE